MKQCPVCQNTYTDETLTFCLSDGTRLNDFYVSAETVQLPHGVKPTEANYGRVNIPINSLSTETKIIPPAVVTNQTERKGCSPLAIVAIFGLVGIFAIAGIAVAYFAFKDNSVVQNNTASPTPNVTNNNNSNSKEQELKDKLDKLQKQLDDQKKAANKSTPATNSTPPPPPTPTGSAKTAQVNSPADGFLAMRSGPSHKTGSQIMKIPHGATVNVYNCQGYTTIASKTGRWCQVSYAGYSGWAFDAWLIYI
jgi:Bacterial SH3 domain